MTAGQLEVAAVAPRLQLQPVLMPPGGSVLASPALAISAPALPPSWPGTPGLPNS